MKINTKGEIPYSDPKFQKIVNTFVFYCPAATVTSKKKEKNKKWDNVSARDCSFRSRGITGTLLSTITAHIKRILKNELYKKIGNDEKVDIIFESDSSSEKIVFKANSQMSDSEVVYYYIRNAFAHGSFEVIDNGERFYKLESKKRDNIKAQMILKESTLMKLGDLSLYSKKQIEALQKKKKR